MTPTDRDKRLCRWINALGFPSALLVDSVHDLRDGIVFCDLVSVLVNKSLCRPQHATTAEEVYVVFEVALEALRREAIIDVSKAGPLWRTGTREPSLQVICRLFEMLKGYVEETLGDNEKSNESSVPQKVPHNPQSASIYSRVSDHFRDADSSPKQLRFAPTKRALRKDETAVKLSKSARRKSHKQQPTTKVAIEERTSPRSHKPQSTTTKVANKDLKPDRRHSSVVISSKKQYMQEKQTRYRPIPEDQRSKEHTPSQGTSGKPAWNASTLVESRKPRSNRQRVRSRSDALSVLNTTSENGVGVSHGPSGKGTQVGTMWDPSYSPKCAELFDSIAVVDSKPILNATRPALARRMRPTREHSEENGTRCKHRTTTEQVSTIVNPHKTFQKQSAHRPTQGSSTINHLNQFHNATSAKLPPQLSRIYDWLVNVGLSSHLACSCQQRSTNTPRVNGSTDSSRVEMHIQTSQAAQVARKSMNDNLTVCQVAERFSDGILLCLLLGNVVTTRDFMINGTEKMIEVNGTRERCILPRGVTPNPETKAAKTRNVNVALDLLRSQKRLSQRFLWSMDKILNGDPVVIWGLLGDIRDTFGYKERSTTPLLLPSFTSHDMVPDAVQHQEDDRSSPHLEDRESRGRRRRRKTKIELTAKNLQWNATSTRNDAIRISFDNHDTYSDAKQAIRRAASHSPTPRKKPTPTRATEREINGVPQVESKFLRKQAEKHSLSGHPLLLCDSPLPKQARNNIIGDAAIVDSVERQTRRRRIGNPKRSNLHEQLQKVSSSPLSIVSDPVPHVTKSDENATRAWLHQLGFNILRVPDDKRLETERTDSTEYHGFEGGPAVFDPFRNGVLFHQLLTKLDPSVRSFNNAKGFGDQPRTNPEPNSFQEAKLNMEHCLALLRTIAGAESLAEKPGIPQVFLFSSEPYLKGNTDYIFGLLGHMRILYGESVAPLDQCEKDSSKFYKTHRNRDIHPSRGWGERNTGIRGGAENSPQRRGSQILSYSTPDIRLLELSLLSWLYGLGVFNPYGLSGVPDNFDEPLLRDAVQSGILLCDLVGVLLGTRLTGIYRNPKTVHTKLQNFKIAFRALRSIPNMGTVFLQDPERLLNGDRHTFLGLLEDAHRMYDGAKPNSNHSGKPYFGDHVPTAVEVSLQRDELPHVYRARLELYHDNTSSPDRCPILSTEQKHAQGFQQPHVVRIGSKQPPRQRVVSIDCDWTHEPYLDDDDDSKQSTGTVKQQHLDVEEKQLQIEHKHDPDFVDEVIQSACDIFPAPFPFAYPSEGGSSKEIRGSSGSNDVFPVTCGTVPMNDADEFFRSRVRQKVEQAEMDDWTTHGVKSKPVQLFGVDIPPTTVLVDWLFDLGITLQNPELLEFDYGEEFADGLILCQIAEQLLPIKGGLLGVERNPRTHASKRHNIRIALTHLERIRKLPLEALQDVEGILLGDNQAIVPLLAILREYSSK